MRAGIFFTGSGPILIVTSYDSLDAPPLVEKLLAKGIDKYLAFDVPVALVKEKYGTHYTVVMHDLKQQDDLRVMDFDGRHVFRQFSFDEMGAPTYHESQLAHQR